MLLGRAPFAAASANAVRPRVFRAADGARGASKSRNRALARDRPTLTQSATAPIRPDVPVVRASRRRKPVVRFSAGPVPFWARVGLVVWVAQLAFLGYFFADLTWENYWWCRWLYRPGLRAFSATMGGVLPGYFFSPFSRTGVVTGFLFASLLYTAIVATTATAVRRVAPAGLARKRK
jgi:hypothetical protein